MAAMRSVSLCRMWPTLRIVVGPSAKHATAASVITVSVSDPVWLAADEITYSIQGRCGRCNNFAGAQLTGTLSFTNYGSRQLISSNFSGGTFQIDNGSDFTTTNNYALGFWGPVADRIASVTFNTGTAVLPATGMLVTGSLASRIPGGDLGGKYTTTSVGNALGSTYTFDVTSLVQRTVNGDFGSRYTRVALLDTGALTEAYRFFYSTRASNTAYRPRLVISYGSASQSVSSGGTTIKVMQWNIHETKGSDATIRVLI